VFRYKAARLSDKFSRIINIRIVILSLKTKVYLPLIILLSLPFCVAEQDSTWTRIDEGLHWSDFRVPTQLGMGDSKILIVKVDPKIYEFRLLSASELSSGTGPLNVREWTDTYKLIGAINAGMFQADLKSNVGYMKNYAHMNNPRIHRTYRSVFAFNPRKADFPPSMIFDTDVKDMKQVIDEYHTVIQNLRLIKRPRLNRWAQQEKRWSEAALGQDHDGNLLFIFSETAYTMHEFGNILLALPIQLECAQHLEGGPSASLYLHHAGVELKRAGSVGLPALRNSTADGFLPIPNVIGITKKLTHSQPVK
jgi:hypothetical protein